MLFFRKAGRDIADIQDHAATGIKVEVDYLIPVNSHIATTSRKIMFI